jgi:ferrous iron transport protein B
MDEHVTRLALVGSPNCGKTTLFNALTGLRQRVANYPGVTVEHTQGSLEVEAEGGAREVLLLDLPGTYSLDPLSPDEQVTLDAIEGRLEGVDAPEGIVIVADATTLERALPFVGEVLRLGRPSLVVLTMIDELKARRGAVKMGALRRALGVKVLGVVGNKGLGLDDLTHELGRVETWKAADPEAIPADQLERFVWADEVLAQGLTRPDDARPGSDAIDRVVLHPVLGVALFLLVMFLFFQVVFTVAAPLQEALEGLVVGFGALVGGAMAPGLLRSLLVDGLINGVGGVVVFVPQIALLLLMISLLEGSGYMARAAFVIDRVMGWAGLEGRCFVALLSSYACAIPGLMATRSVPDPKSRLATMMVAPFMTCSARLPVYGLLIGAFVPDARVGGVFSLQGLTMFGLYALGSLSALVAAVVFKRGALRGRTYPFYMELPPYRVPSWRVVLNYVWRGVKGFMRKAGTIILVASVVLWAMLSFPQVEPPASLAEDPAAARAYQLERSAAAQVGKAIEPAIAPLGFDWRIGIGIVASFAAREVIVATLSQIYSFEGDEEDLEGLGERLKKATRDDGAPAYTLATALSLLVFYVYALQCVSTLAVMRRETGTWRWPATAFIYMLVVAWLASFITYQLTANLTSAPA